jgi:hypothetical protein
MSEFVGRLGCQTETVRSPPAGEIRSDHGAFIRKRVEFSQLLANRCNRKKKISSERALVRVSQPVEAVRNPNKQAPEVFDS